jgi:hypothetical protein
VPIDASWWFDERAHAGPEHLDVDYVASYDRKSPTDWTEDVAALLALGVGATSTVVDLGAGTGGFALAIAPHVARVVAVATRGTRCTTCRTSGRRSRSSASRACSGLAGCSA